MSAAPIDLLDPACSPRPRESVVQATAAVVAEHAEQITARFYPRMFEEHPELLRVFNQGNQATGEQSRALAASVVAYAVQLIDPDAPSFDRVMQRIAYKHISLGIRPEQYTIVGHHLLAAVGEVLGDAVTPEIAAAWDEVYWLFATQLVAAGGPALPAGGRRPGAPAAAVPRGPADRGDRRRRVPGARARRRRRRCRRSARGSTSRCSSTCPTAGASRASTPSPPRPSATRLQITVRRVHGVGGAPDGMVSSYLHDQAAVGDVLDVSAPGRRLRRPALRRPAAAGERRRRDHHGAADRRAHRPDPAAAQGHRRARRPDGAGPRAARDGPARRAGRSTTSPPTPGTRRVDPADHRSAAGLHGPRRRCRWPTDVQVFTCGPLPFMRHVRSSLLARGVPASAHPLRGVRARPVGAPGLTHRSGADDGRPLTAGVSTPVATTALPAAPTSCRQR